LQKDEEMPFDAKTAGFGAGIGVCALIGLILIIVGARDVKEIQTTYALLQQAQTIQAAYNALPAQLTLNTTVTFTGYGPGRGMGVMPNSASFYQTTNATGAVVFTATSAAAAGVVDLAPPSPNIPATPNTTLTFTVGAAPVKGFNIQAFIPAILPLGCTTAPNCTMHQLQLACNTTYVGGAFYASSIMLPTGYCAQNTKSCGICTYQQRMYEACFVLTAPAEVGGVWVRNTTSFASCVYPYGEPVAPTYSSGLLADIPKLTNGNPYAMRIILRSSNDPIYAVTNLLNGGNAFDDSESSHPDKTSGSWMIFFGVFFWVAAGGIAFTAYRNKRSQDEYGSVPAAWRSTQNP